MSIRSWFGVTAKPFAANNRVLEFEYFCTEEIDSVSAFSDRRFPSRHGLIFPIWPIAQGWQTYAADLVIAMEKPIPGNTSQLRIDFGMKPNVRLQIRGIQLRPRTPKRNRGRVDRVCSATAENSLKVKQISQYLDSTFPGRFDDVTVDDQFVTLAGTMDREMKQVDFAAVG